MRCLEKQLKVLVKQFCVTDSNSFRYVGSDFLHFLVIVEIGLPVLRCVYTYVRVVMSINKNLFTQPSFLGLITMELSKWQTLVFPKTHMRRCTLDRTKMKG